MGAELFSHNKNLARFFLKKTNMENMTQEMIAAFLLPIYIADAYGTFKFYVSHFYAHALEKEDWRF
jgi:hypothetical protein